MNNLDFDYPLPQEYLHSRYGSLFQAINKGLNVTLIGLPQSSRSSFLKFIISRERLLESYINTSVFQFLNIDIKEYPENKYIDSIAFEITGEMTGITEDPLLTLSYLKKVFTSAKKPKRVVFVIYETDEFKIKNPETFKFILDLLAINKHAPNLPGFQAIFISSPKNADVGLSDKVFQFDLFTKKEIDYTRMRLEFFREQKISDKVHKLACELSFGHYLLYKFLSDLTVSELQKIRIIKNHENLNNLLEIIWKGTGSISIIKRFNPLTEPVLLPPVSKFIREGDFSDIVKLTAQERLLFDLLKTKNDITSRDEIAQTIWRAQWTEKYSDWAIDKLISKLKRKLTFSKYEILTLKNRGYQLSNHAG
jgi:DNA-binding winged helix-turn-helix (wHTH) protein